MNSKKHSHHQSLHPSHPHQSKSISNKKNLFKNNHIQQTLQKLTQQTHPNFRISHNSIPQHFSYFNPYQKYQMRQPSQIYHFNFQKHKEIQKDFQSSPGPGDYQIGLPIVKPKYSTIVKNNNAVILKLNDTVQGTSSFKSKFNRFYSNKIQLQLIKSPGPGTYSLSKRLSSEQRERQKKKIAEKKKQNKRIKQQYIKSILRKQKVESMKDYIVLNQQQIQKQRQKVKQKNKSKSINCHPYNNVSSRYEESNNLGSVSSQYLLDNNSSSLQKDKSYIRKKYLPLIRSLNQTLLIQRQKLPVFYAPERITQKQQQNALKKQKQMTENLFIDPFFDLHVGVTKKQKRMSIDSQKKFSNTFYNRQLLDVILGIKDQQQLQKQFSNQQIIKNLNQIDQQKQLNKNKIEKDSLEHSLSISTIKGQQNPNQKKRMQSAFSQASLNQY